MNRPVDTTRIAASTAERQAVIKTIKSLGVRDLTLPAGTSRTPPLPVGEHWITASGASLANGVLVYVHGGGFTHRNPPLMNLLAEPLSRVTGRPALVVHYPLAPDEPYPAALDAVVATHRELLRHVPAERIVYYSESSGGTLTLSAMLRLARLEQPAGVVAVSPITDLALRSPSIDANVDTDIGVTRELLAFLIGQYLQLTPADEAPQSPIRGDLGRMPPLLLAAGTAEAVLDDTLRFGAAASAAGGKVRVDLYEGMPHAFTLAVLDDLRVGRILLDRVAAWMR